MVRIAIMQGRLLPPQNGFFQCFPREHWAEEFSCAAEAGLNAIEWIYDLQSAGANPIETDEGVATLFDLSRRNGIEVVSLCADYYMDRPFVTSGVDEERQLIGHFLWLLQRCEKAGITRVVVPFVDASRIENLQQQARVIDILGSVLPAAEERNVELHLETSLSPEEFRLFLRNFDTPFIKVNYDSGNSSSLGYDPREEIAAYGKRIGSVHIKDRVKGAGSVPLGQGAADFDALFAGLRAVQYAGDYVLQVARAKPGDEVNWARQNRSFLLQYLNANERRSNGGAN